MTHELTMVLHPMTWIHLGIGLTEMTRAPMFVGGGLMLIQRLLGDTYTYPVLWAAASMLISILYISFGERIEGMPVVPTGNEQGRLVPLAIALLLDVIWTPYVGLIFMMLITRLLDHYFITGPWHVRLAREKTSILFICYAFLIADHQSMNPKTRMGSQNASIVLFLLVMGIVSFVGWIQNNRHWQAPPLTLAQPDRPVTQPDPPRDQVGSKKRK